MADLYWYNNFGVFVDIGMYDNCDDLVPPTFIKLNNQVSLAGTSLNNCNNPMGFNIKDDSLYCNNVSVGNPTAGLVLRDLSARNQFFLVYVNLIIENKADPRLCN